MCSLVAVVGVAPSVALAAGTPRQQQYDVIEQELRTEKAPRRAHAVLPAQQSPGAVAAVRGALPFTGLQVGIALALGGALVASGVGLRRITRHKRG